MPSWKKASHYVVRMQTSNAWVSVTFTPQAQKQVRGPRTQARICWRPSPDAEPSPPRSLRWHGRKRMKGAERAKLNPSHQLSQFICQLES